MPETVYDIDLNGQGDILRVRFATEDGAVIDFLVQYEATIDGKRKAVVRYDSHHGRGHRDMLDWNGRNHHKDWAPEGIGLGAVLTWAVDDLMENWERYRTEFLQRRDHD